MRTKEPQIQTQLLSRLNRIEGQVRGVHNMILEERDCQEILQQFTSIRSAGQSATLLFVQEYATDCLLNLDENDPHQREQFVRDLMGLLGKVP